MTRRCGWWVAAVVVLALGTGPVVRAADGAKPDAPKKPAPKVEVVFCLDTTGSMTGLIEGAKQKIWAVCNQILDGKPTPDLKVGLVAFRDRGDKYITKVFDLTDDLDAVYANLKEFKADGGGDIPESVNQALHESVTKIKWSKDKGTLKIVFLVGDAPPHMDYPDDVKYPETCKLAVKEGIVINTIQCGGDAECRKHWQEIALKAEGSYVQIEQKGGVVAVSTPFDKRLGEINTEMAKSTLVYGDARRKLEGEAKKADAEKLAPAAPGAAADRAAASGKAKRISTYDLMDDIKAKKVTLKDLKDEQLPEELRKIPAKDRQAYLEKVEAKREELRKEAIDLDKKRTEFIKKELEKKGKGKDAFDTQVLEIIRKQAKKHKIDY